MTTRPCHRLAALLVLALALPARLAAAEPAATPPAAQPPAAPAESELDRDFRDLRTTAADGQNGPALARIATKVQAAAAGSADATDLARRLAEVLTGDAPPYAKRFACRQLSVAGTPAAVPPLAALLAQPDCADLARYALQRIPGHEATDALRAALGTATGPQLAAILHTLGERRDDAAVPELAARLRTAEPDPARAAAQALGRMGTEPSLQALLAVLDTVPAETRPALVAATLEGADRLLRDQPGAPSARQAAGRLWTADLPAWQRAAALLLLVAAEAPDARQTVVTALASPDRTLRRAAVTAARRLPDATTTDALAATLPGLPPETQVLLLHALAERGDRRALPAVLALAAATDPEVAVAALQALGDLGDATAVPALARAAGTPGGTQAVARSSLERAAGDTVDQALIQAVPAAEPDLRAELVRVLGARGSPGTVAVLLGTARDPGAKVRRETWPALIATAREADLPAIVDLLTASPEGADRAELEKVVAAVARNRIADETRRVAAVLAALGKAADAGLRASLLAVLGRVASPAGFDALSQATADPDPDVRKAAVRALADWPDAAPLTLLREAAATTQDPVLRVLALRGFAKQLGLPSDRTYDDSIRLFREGMQLAPGAAEQKLFLSSLASLPHPRTIEFLQPFLENPDLRDEALFATTRILRTLDETRYLTTASHGAGAEGQAVDGDRKTRWTTGEPQKNGQWFQLDLRYERELRSLTLDAGDVGADYPRGYQVLVSANGRDWGAPVATGAATQTVCEIALTPPCTTRYVRIVQTADSGGMFWSICELAINGRGVGAEEAGATLDRKAWKVTASARAEEAGKGIDDDPKTRWDTGGPQKPGQWFQVDLGEPRTVHKVFLDAAASGGDFPNGYEVYVSDDPDKPAAAVAKGSGDKAQVTIPTLARRGRYVRIVQTGTTDTSYWSIHEMSIVGE